MSDAQLAQWCLAVINEFGGAHVNLLYQQFPPDIYAVGAYKSALALEAYGANQDTLVMHQPEVDEVTGTKRLPSGVYAVVASKAIVALEAYVQNRHSVETEHPEEDQPRTGNLRSELLQEPN